MQKNDYSSDYYQDRNKLIDVDEDSNIYEIVKNNFIQAVLDKDRERLEFFLEKKFDVFGGRIDLFSLLVRYSESDLVEKFYRASKSREKNMPGIAQEITNVMWLYDRADLIDFFIEEGLVKKDQIEERIFRHVSANILKKYLEEGGEKTTKNNLDYYMTIVMGDIIYTLSQHQKIRYFAKNQKITDIIDNIENNKIFKFVSTLIDNFGLKKVQDSTYGAINYFSHMHHDLSFYSDIVILNVLGVIEMNVGPAQYFGERDYGLNEFLKNFNRCHQKNWPDAFNLSIEKYSHIGPSKENIFNFKGRGLETEKIEELLLSKKEEIWLKRKINNYGGLKGHKI